MKVPQMLRLQHLQFHKNYFILLFAINKLNQSLSEAPYIFSWNMDGAWLHFMYNFLWDVLYQLLSGNFLFPRKVEWFSFNLKSIQNQPKLNSKILLIIDAYLYVNWLFFLKFNHWSDHILQQPRKEGAIF